MMELTREQKTLLRLLSGALHDETAGEFPPDLDWDSLLKECRQQTVMALSYFGADAAALPGDVKQSWKKIAYKEVGTYYRVCMAHVEVGRLLEEHGIPTVILKGCASAQYYPHPEYRAMGDVDFYVAPEDVEKSRALLEANGYTDDHRIGDHDHSYHKNNIHFELHFAVSGVPHGEEGEPFRRALAALLAERRHIETRFGPLCVPSDFHHGLILLLHTASHLLGGGLGLRHICDWAAFVGRFPDAAFCDLFEEPLRELKLWRFAQVLTRCCECFLELPARGWTRDVDEDTAALLLNEFLTTGNFGAKETRQSDLMLSEGFSVHLGKKSGFATLLAVLRRSAEQRWPVIERVRLLLPFGMLGLALRYGFRMLTGKREKLHFIAMSREAEARKRLFQSFGLDDGEKV